MENAIFVIFLLSFLLIKCFLLNNYIMWQAVRANVEWKHCTYKRLVHLMIEICIDCNLQESNYWPQAMLLWMPYKSYGSDQLTNEILQHTLSLLCLSLLPSQTYTQWALCTEQQAAVYISGQPYISLSQSHSALCHLRTTCEKPRL